jgi:hypothetical protein
MGGALKRSAWLGNALAAAAIFLVNAALNGPLFLPGEMPFRDSIEGGYASMVRFFAAHPDPWGWNPTAYCGLPAQFTYLPGLPYLAAAVTWLAPGLEPAYAYRLITAVLACLGPVSVFFFVLYFTGSRRWALAAALAYTLCSPSYGLFRTIEKDRGIVQLPWRIQVLAKYGEGPHNAGLTLLPMAVVALWAAAAGRKRRQILAAALLLAALALTNWVAALAAALCALTLLVTLAFEKDARARVLTIAGAGVLAYLVACFWLTPSFVRTTALNWPADAFNYQLESAQIWLLVGLPAALLALRALLARMKVEAYRCFVTLAAFAFGWIVVIYYSHGLSTIPESRRYAVEFELFLLLALVEWLRWALQHPYPMLRRCAIGCAAIMLLAGAGQAARYVTQGYAPWRPFPKERSIEYRCGRALAERAPAGRIFASGGLRYRLNSWFELQQVGGTFESGLRNRIPVHMAYQIRTGIGSVAGQEGQDAVLQLKALGVEYVVVHGPKSKEHYRDVRNPRKFEGLLESVYREGDDVIYRVPFRSLAHLVRAAELPAGPPVGSDRQLLRPYVAALEDASRPKLLARWHGPNRLEIEGPVPEGMRVSVQVSYHPGWVASQDERPLEIEQDGAGFMVLRARPAGFSRIELSYRGAFEQRAAAFVSAITLLAGLAGLGRRRFVAGFS